MADELIGCLDKLKLQSHKTDRWASFRAALKTIWSKERIDILTKRLSDFREQLSLRVLLLLNAQYAQHDEKLELLHKDHKEIVEVVSINFGSLRSMINEYHERRDERQQDKRADAARSHTETLAAILTTRDGDCRTITGPQYSAEFATRSSTANIRTAITYKQTFQTANQPDGESPDFETTQARNLTAQIMDALHFRNITERFAAVAEAHQRTFRWIYRDPAPEGKPWDNFSEWLQSGQGCYWINGKAGSGKSTLMKYIQENSITRTLLKVWTGDSELVFGSFYFWYAGTSLQKSQPGLLRSLLLGVLAQRPDMVPIIFPDVSRSILANQLVGRIDLSYIELKKAFITLVNSVPNGLKIFFMVDGIDEYEGDHNEICDLFSQATTTSNSIKILLSSRPIPSCVHAFSSFPRLRLQDLTYPDIEYYVEAKLSRNPLTHKLEAAEPGTTPELVAGITSKASGVFLWVILVVRSLLNGLQDYDTRSDLLLKLDELPPDLEKLYDHMLGSMSPQNRRQGSELLQLVLRSMETHGAYPLTVLQLSFAEDGGYARPFRDEDCGLTAEQEQWRCEAIEGRLRSRTCGLIEVHDSPSPLPPRSARSPVGFLHRTVLEFLQTDTVWSRLVCLTNGSNFDVAQGLLRSALSEIKAKTGVLCKNMYKSAAYCAMFRILSYEQRMKDSYDLIHCKYLPELKKTLLAYFSLGQGSSEESVEVQRQAKAVDVNQRCNQFRLSHPEPFLLFAAINCPTNWFQSLLEFYCSALGSGPINDEAAVARLAGYLLLLYADEVQASTRLAISTAVIICIKKPNASPVLPLAWKQIWNQRRKLELYKYSNNHLSFWEYILRYIVCVTQLPQDKFSDFAHFESINSLLDLLVAMVERGAEANHSFIVDARVHSCNPRLDKTCEVSAFAIIYQYLMRVWKKHRLSTELLSENSTPQASQASLMFTANASHLEYLMESKGAKMWTRGLPHKPPGASKTPKFSGIARLKPPKASGNRGSDILTKPFIATAVRSASSSTVSPAMDLRDSNCPKKPLVVPPLSPWRVFLNGVLTDKVLTVKVVEVVDSDQGTGEHEGEESDSLDRFVEDFYSKRHYGEPAFLRWMRTIP